MKTIAYLRVSKDSQDVRNQRLAILEFARQEQLTLTDYPFKPRPLGRG